MQLLMVFEVVETGTTFVVTVIVDCIVLTVLTEMYFVEVTTAVDTGARVIRQEHALLIALAPYPEQKAGVDAWPRLDFWPAECVGGVAAPLWTTVAVAVARGRWVSTVVAMVITSTKVETSVVRRYEEQNEDAIFEIGGYLRVASRLVIAHVTACRFTGISMAPPIAPPPYATTLRMGSKRIVRRTADDGAT